MKTVTSNMLYCVVLTLGYDRTMLLKVGCCAVVPVTSYILTVLQWQSSEERSGPSVTLEQEGQTTGSPYTADHRQRWPGFSIMSPPVPYFKEGSATRCHHHVIVVIIVVVIVIDIIVFIIVIIVIIIIDIIVIIIVRFIFLNHMCV